tara:strand:- start:1423 stop:1626 length:204 start_codon:yes stop_codon:yes gene_type:complete
MKWRNTNFSEIKWGKPLKKKQIKKCIICKEEIQGFGNNAEPIKKGICCGLCNDLYVIPARIKQLKNK